MKRGCGMVFLLAALFFFPFPNSIMAPGYQSLPELHVPSLREVASELPPPWNERTINAMSQTSWFYVESMHTVHFGGAIFRTFLYNLGLKLFARQL